MLRGVSNKLGAESKKLGKQIWRIHLRQMRKRQGKGQLTIRTKTAMIGTDILGNDRDNRYKRDLTWCPKTLIIQPN